MPTQALSCPKGHLLKLKPKERFYRGHTGLHVKHCSICERKLERKDSRWHCEHKCGYYCCEDCYTKLMEDEIRRAGTGSSSELGRAVDAACLLPSMAILAGGASDEDTDDEATPEPEEREYTCDGCRSCLPCWLRRKQPDESYSKLDAPLKSEPVLERREAARQDTWGSTGSEDPMVCPLGSEQQLFHAVETAAAIGGIEVRSPHSDHLLPPEVVLFEPSASERHMRGNRLIFLNTKLTKEEQQSLAALHTKLEEEDLITKRGDHAFPPYVRLHALRIMQQSKQKTEKAVNAMASHLNMRVKLLPLIDADMRELLKRGLIYIHGRDRKCRPCLIWRMQRLTGWKKDDAVKVVLFVLEYAVRYALVPGRVENWILLVDLEGVGVSNGKGENASIFKAIATLLEHVYCGRAYCTKIINLPWIIKGVVTSFIPEDKKEKVEFLGSNQIPAAMAALFEPHQLERGYGGTAPNLSPEETYPFHFFPNCTGQEQQADWSDKSLHGFTSREFHEGALWDEFSAEIKGTWFDGVSGQSLTATSVTELKGMGQDDVAACSDLKSWFRLVNPEEARRRKY